MNESETLDIIRRALPHARKAAARVGSQHGAWEYISDAESVLRGGRSRLSGNRAEVLAALVDGLGKYLPAGSSE